MRKNDKYKIKCFFLPEQEHILCLAISLLKNVSLHFSFFFNVNKIALAENKWKFEFSEVPNQPTLQYPKSMLHVAPQTLAVSLKCNEEINLKKNPKHLLEIYLLPHYMSQDGIILYDQILINTVSKHFKSHKKIDKKNRNVYYCSQSNTIFIQSQSEWIPFHCKI